MRKAETERHGFIKDVIVGFKPCAALIVTCSLFSVAGYAAPAVLQKGQNVDTSHSNLTARSSTPSEPPRYSKAALEKVTIANELFALEMYYECVKSYYEAFQMGYVLSDEDMVKFEKSFRNESTKIKKHIEYYEKNIALGRNGFEMDIEICRKKLQILILCHKSVKAEVEVDRKAAEAEAKRKAAEEAEAKRKAAEEAAKRKFAEDEAKRKAREAEVREKVNLARELFEIKAYYDCVKAYYEVWLMGYAISGDDAVKFEKAYKNENNRLTEQIRTNEAEQKLGGSVDNHDELEKKKADIIKWHTDWRTQGDDRKGDAIETPDIAQPVSPQPRRP